MIPIHDNNPTRHPPILTITFIALNAIVFFWQIAGSTRQFPHRLFSWAAVPFNITSSEGDHRIVYVETGDRAGFALEDELPARPPRTTITPQAIPAWLTLLTCMFLHGGWMHLIGNMVFLWIFGNNIEDAVGRVRFVLFYLLTGLVASAAHILTDPESPIPTVGASGAISGVLGGYLVLYPRARILTLIPLGFFLQTLSVPAMVFLPLWFVLQIVNAGRGGGVAWWAHIGGFLAGLALIKLFESREHRSREPHDPGATSYGRFPRSRTGGPLPRRPW